MLESFSKIVGTSVTAVLMVLLLPDCSTAKTSERVIQLIILSKVLKLIVFPLIVNISGTGR